MKHRRLTGLVASSVALLLTLGFACVDADIPNVSNDLRDALAENFANAGAAGASASGSGGSASTPNAGAGGEGGAAGSGGEPGEPETDGGVGGSSMAGVAGSEGEGAAGAGPVLGCDGFEVLQAHCANASCHGQANAAFGGFAASPDAARDYIDVESNAACANQGAIVNTDDPAASLLITKITGEADCGSPMPLGGEPLTDDEIACLEDWIAGF